MSSGGGGTNTTVQNADPWKGQQPYLEKGFAGAEQGILNQPGQGDVPLSPETQYSLYHTGNRALQGSPLLGQAQGQASSTLAGDYMSGGPGYESYLDSVVSSVRPQVDSMFARGGRSGSPGHQEALGRGIGRGMAPLYDSERGRQMQAMAGAPGLAQADYADMSMLGNVGAAREGQQRTINDEAYNRLSRYMGLVGGMGYGGTTTTSGGAGSSPLLGAMGGGMMGASMGSQIYPDSNWGAGLGGLAGGLAGYYM